MTLLILCIAKRLVWADNIICIPERFVHSDVRAQEGNVSLGELPIVTRAFVSCAAESETGVDSLGSDFTRTYVKYDTKYIKNVVCFGCGNSSML